jgi:hypothetical protein
MQDLSNMIHSILTINLNYFLYFSENLVVVVVGT